MDGGGKACGVREGSSVNMYVGEGLSGGLGLGGEAGMAREERWAVQSLVQKMLVCSCLRASSLLGTWLGCF